MSDEPLTVGLEYDFETADGTVYERATLLEETDDGVWISWGIARVFIADHELAQVIR